MRSRPHGHQYKMVLTTPLSTLLMVSTRGRQDIFPLPEPCLSHGVIRLMVGNQSWWCTSPTLCGFPKFCRKGLEADQAILGLPLLQKVFAFSPMWNGISYLLKIARDFTLLTSRFRISHLQSVTEMLLMTRMLQLLYSHEVCHITSLMKGTTILLLCKTAQAPPLSYFRNI